MTEQAKKTLLDNHYDVIGVAQTASEQEIRDGEMAMRKVYEHRAHQGDAQATDMLRRLNEASAVLLRPSFRAEHDRDVHTQWDAFVDVSFSPPLARGERLSALRAWLEGEPDPLRAGTRLDGPNPLDRLKKSALLGDQEG